MLSSSRACLLAAAWLVACDVPSADGDGGTSCGASTCTSSQVCAYRECSETERCKPSAQCPAGSTPTTCGGQPGCLLAPTQCGPVVVGCKDVPPACKNDMPCACNAVCGGDAGACARIDGRNVDCAVP